MALQSTAYLMILTGSIIYTQEDTLESSPGYIQGTKEEGEGGFKLGAYTSNLSTNIGMVVLSSWSINAVIDCLLISEKIVFFLNKQQALTCLHRFLLIVYQIEIIVFI